MGIQGQYTGDACRSCPHVPGTRVTEASQSVSAVGSVGYSLYLSLSWLDSLGALESLALRVGRGDGSLPALRTRKNFDEP